MGMTFRGDMVAVEVEVEDDNNGGGGVDIDGSGPVWEGSRMVCGEVILVIVSRWDNFPAVSMCPLYICVCEEYGVDIGEVGSG